MNIYTVLSIDHIKSKYIHIVPYVTVESEAHSGRDYAECLVCNVKQLSF